MARRNGLAFIGNDKVVPTNRFWARDEMPESPIDSDESYSSDDNGDW
jgi:hypothetical protein